MIDTEQIEVLSDNMREQIEENLILFDMGLISHYQFITRRERIYAETIENTLILNKM